MESRMSKGSRHSGLLGIVAVSALLLTGCGSTATPTDPGTDDESKAPASITLAIASAAVAPKEEVVLYAVGAGTGRFDDENLTVDYLNADGSTAAIQAVLSGSADITVADAGSALAAAEKGAPIVITGKLMHTQSYRIAVLEGSPIKTAADVKGKRIGIISLASGSRPFSEQFILQSGMSLDDVTLIPVGVGAQALAALQKGEVDVLALYTQAYTSIEFKENVKFTYLEQPEMLNDVASYSFITTEKVLSEKKDAVARFMKVAYESMVFSKANPTAAMELGYKAFPQLEKAPGDVPSFQAWLDSAAAPSWDGYQFGYISDAQWKTTLDYVTAAGQISGPMPIEKFWDPSLLEAAGSFDVDAVIREAENAK